MIELNLTYLEAVALGLILDYTDDGKINDLGLNCVQAVQDKLAAALDSYEQKQKLMSQSITEWGRDDA